MPIKWFRWVEKQRAEEQYEKDLASISTQTLTRLCDTLSIALKAMDERTDEWDKVYSTFCKVNAALQCRKDKENKDE